jgi:hypothetical protein
MVENASLPSNRAAGACGDFFDFRGPRSAATRFLRGAWAPEAKPNPQIREVPWRKVSVLMSALFEIFKRRGNRLDSPKLAPHADDFRSLPYPLSVLWRQAIAGPQQTYEAAGLTVA